jgi:hypothetical protein
MSSLLVIFVLGGVAILQVLNLVRNRVLNSCRIWSATQLNTPPSTATHCLYINVLYVYFGKEGGGQREGTGATVHKGQQFTRWVENTNHEWMYLQSIKSVKTHVAKSINRTILKKSWHLGFGVFIIHSSMPLSPACLPSCVCSPVPPDHPIQMSGRAMYGLVFIPVCWQVLSY